MKLLSHLLLSLIVFVSLAAAQSVVVTNHKVTYTRPKPISEYKKSFVVNYPKVKAATPALSRTIEDTISYGRILEINIKEEINEAQWLEEASYDVKYNKNGALAVDLTMEGSGAYPDGSTKTVLVDTATGTRATPAASFRNQSDLVTAIRKRQEKEIAETTARIKKEDPDADLSMLFGEQRFAKKDLDWFGISNRGVTFHYDYGFPHVAVAYEPAGKFFFSWEQLKPYIKPGSLLSRVAR